MRAYQKQGESGLQLSQTRSQPREAMLSRMREKLASPSLAPTPGDVRKVAVRRERAFGWAWKVWLAVLAVGVNAFLFAFRDQLKAEVKEKRAPSLPVLATSLPLEKQALYWAYALYDYEKLKKEFGAPKSAVIDANHARRKLAEILPKVDRRTRFTITSYRPQRTRK